jgi:hypothetical protein
MKRHFRVAIAIAIVAVTLAACRSWRALQSNGTNDSSSV